jgi:hypothetical protein
MLDRPTQIVTPTQDVIKKMQDDVVSRLHAKLEAIEETYEANKPAFAARNAQDAYWCTGTLNLTSVFINTGIKINNLEFKDFSEVLKFKGTSWGLGVGYGTSFGTGVFYDPPRNLIGKKVNIELAFFIVGAGVIQTSFWEGSMLCGAMDFVGGGGGAGGFWGSGSFSRE